VTQKGAKEKAAMARAAKFWPPSLAPTLKRSGRLRIPKARERKRKKKAKAWS
jgi:hypothetical protein